MPNTQIICSFFLLDSFRVLLFASLKHTYKYALTYCKCSAAWKTLDYVFECFCFFFYMIDLISKNGYVALLVRISIKAKFVCRSVGIKKEEKTDKKDDAKKSEKDGKDEGKEKDDQKAGPSDRSRASKSGNSSGSSEIHSKILVLFLKKRS